MLGTGLAGAQDMEPRRIRPLRSSQFSIGSYQRTTGDVALDTDLPISRPGSDQYGHLAYNRTFDRFCILPQKWTTVMPRGSG
jgi:hypothetical protein